MSDTSKKQNFLEGAAVLTIATILVKVIGACFKIPLNRLIGSVGYGHFTVSYDIYTVLLTIATAGLPVAVSRMISEAIALNDRGRVRKIYRVSFLVFLILGVAGFLFMFLGAGPLSRLMNDPDSYYAILALSPAVLMVCIVSSFRGYFQGQQYMTPTAVSQVIEALCKLILGLGFVVIAVKLGKSSGAAAGGAILGITIGTVLSAVYMFLQYLKRSRAQAENRIESSSYTSAQAIRQLLRYAVPITIGASGLQIFNALDTKIILGRLLHGLEMDQETATSQYGLYSAAQTLYMLPSALVQPLAVSIIPSVTEAITLKKHRQARHIEESAIKIACLISMPCAAGFLILSGPVQQMLYGYSAENLAVAAPILRILGIAVLFNCMVVVTNAILQAHGRVSLPIYTTLAGGTVNILTDYFLIGIPSIGINGAAIATISYCAVIMILNLIFLHQHPKESRPRALWMMARPFFATLVMSAAVFLVWKLSSLIFGTSISCLLSILAAVVVYAFMVLKLHIITWSDCRMLPKGEKIAALLHIRKDT